MGCNGAVAWGVVCGLALGCGVSKDDTGVEVAGSETDSPVSDESALCEREYEQVPLVGVVRGQDGESTSDPVEGSVIDNPSPGRWTLFPCPCGADCDDPGFRYEVEIDVPDDWQPELPECVIVDVDETCGAFGCQDTTTTAITILDGTGSAPVLHWVSSRNSTAPTAAEGLVVSSSEVVSDVDCGGCTRGTVWDLTFQLDGETVTLDEGETADLAGYDIVNAHSWTDGLCDGLPFIAWNVKRQ